MNTHIITKDQIDAEGYYTGASAAFDGHLEIAANLGTVRFKLSVSAKGSIIATAGSGIEAGWGIEVKLRVFAGLCIWRIPTEEEQTVTCKKFTGTLAYGKLVETSK